MDDEKVDDQLNELDIFMYQNPRSLSKHFLTNFHDANEST